MNLIEFDKRTVSSDGWYITNDYRSIDHKKIYSILDNMMKNITNILPEFEWSVDIEDDISSYLGESGSYYKTIKIFMKYDNYERTSALKYPALIKDNMFIMNGSIYIPELFLERAPIDIIPDKKKGKKIFLNMLPMYNITINIEENIITIRNKTVDFNWFMKLIFSNNDEDKAYFNSLVEDDILLPVEKKDKLIKPDVIKILGFHDTSYFDNHDLTLSDFFDKYILLDYFKGMFNDTFKVDNIRDILKLIIKYHVEKYEFNMSDITNRRVVMAEYLMSAIFEMYTRLLLGAMDKNDKQAFLPTMNDRVLITSGFQKLMHGGVFFNTSLPYINPTINKISQDIYIINDGRIPKSWSANHPNSIGIVCPISVSAQQMGKNLVLTNDTRINYYGRIELKNGEES